jgi:hypothetical protein
LTRQLPEVLSAFSKEVLQTLKMSTGRLHKSTGSASTGALAQTGLTGAQTGPIVKTVELENVNSYLNEVQAELTELCKGANEAGDAQLVAHLVSALETADGGEFKFLRFPQLVDLLAQETLRLLGPYERKFAALSRELIEQTCRVGNPSITITHDLSTSPMRAHVRIDAA